MTHRWWVRSTGDNVDLCWPLSGEGGRAVLGDWAHSLWGLMPSPGGWGRTELNCRTPSWRQSVAWCHKCCEFSSVWSNGEAWEKRGFSNTAESSRWARTHKLWILIIMLYIDNCFKNSMVFCFKNSSETPECAECWRDPVFCTNLGFCILCLVATPASDYC